ncbi:MAG: acetyl-CoA carboxylase biotin carboxylase subunit [Tissierellia bacterium]|nr:acetyl-CoA carboxylase biotin carboxylase subunit [Tissierellia bacterium]
MFKRILIANRGEIALRIMRACHEMDIETVAIYSTEDRNSLHVRLATESICIGPGKPSESYLSIPKIINAALLTKAEAIHPGYGFLSENEEFVDLVNQCDMVFIGPSKESMSLMGNKSRARQLMLENDIPIVPGSEGSVEDIGELKTICRDIGYPVILKASAGGGGRGMRIVHKEEELEREFLNSKSESNACFGDDNIYVEKYIINPRHIEVQILADKFGSIVHLGERDCSIQRRHQKVLEESPSPRLGESLRQELGAISIRIAELAEYTNAGTVEFIVDDAGRYYFLEMNTRLQVEHTITEMVTGIDIVKEQIRIANDMKLSHRQEDICLRGHSIQCRINGENIFNDFLPTSGRIGDIHIPGGFNIRFDSYIGDNYDISPYYDSMIGKLIVKGENRLEAIKKMRVALEELSIGGIDTNIELHYGILHDFDFVKGNYNTSFLEQKLSGEFKDFYLEMENHYGTEY